jgi:hypothetical protein
MAGKHNRYRTTIMSHQFLQPLAMESEGQMCAKWEEMLLALAKKWAERRLRDDKAARRMQGYWLDELAVIHTRYLARCLINRAAARFATRCVQRCPPRWPSWTLPRSPSSRRRESVLA